MFKSITSWFHRVVASVGTFFSRLFRITIRHHHEPEEQYMKKQKHKEIFAVGETEADRKLEDEYLARMKAHHDLAKADADRLDRDGRGDYTRTRILLSESATILHDQYRDASQSYLETFEDEGADAAYEVWRIAMSHLVDYVHHLDNEVLSTQEPEQDMATAAVG